MSRFNLVSHQRQKWRDDERDTGPLRSQQLCRNEIDHALAPARSLNAENLVDNMFNLDSSVERARVGCWRRVWVIASTLNATAFKEEQHPQTRRQ